MALIDLPRASEEYGRTIITIAALFVAFHAPSWIRAWYRSRFERAFPVVDIGVPAVSINRCCFTIRV